MGSCAYLSIGDYGILDQPSYVDPIFLTIFQGSDKRISEYVDEDNEGNIQRVFQYVVEARYVIQRLEIMGFTLTKTKQLFDEGIANVLEQVKDGNNFRYIRPLGMKQDEKIQFFSQYTFERWSSALCEVITKGIFRYGGKDEEIIASDLLIQFILKDDFDDDFFYGFPNFDLRYFLRAALEVVEPTDEVVLDITELVDNGYYKETDKLTEIARSGLSYDYTASAKIIVLTEGSSDTLALRKTLDLLYPHLSEYYSFLDFGTSNMQGGAANLVSTIKAFIGSGIENKVIAIFDNDTAAQVAMKGLQGLDIPENIAILRYPPLSITENYPTIGPQGILKMNINGLAGSLEIYFGEDILRNENGDFFPVQWKGYDSSLNQYQGEIINKMAVQSAYFEKLKKCYNQRPETSNYDWSGMQKIFESIFKAFE